jgi:two-component system sensor histidine kinase BaeS
VFRSLRFQVPALFLVGVIASGLVAAAIAFQLFQSYTTSRARAELRREASGITELYRIWTPKFNDPPSASIVERATADHVFFIPRTRAGRLFFSPGLSLLPRGTVDPDLLREKRQLEFEFTPAGTDARYLGVARPLVVGGNYWGALAVARPKDQLSNRVVPLLERLALALLGGVVVAGLLAAYVSRRLTKPVLELSHVADEVAEGHYDVDVPAVPGGGEIGHLAERFREMARRLSEAEQQERNFLMSVSHELRTPLTAIRGHVEALREGLVEDPEARAASLDTIALESERLSRLVGDVLDLAKLDAHRFTVLEEEVDMQEVVARAYSSFHDEARRRAIDYRADVRADPVLITDGDRVLQIIVNLLSNAFRWTPDGGRIDLELTHENGSVAVAVRDTGPGIPDELRERIFRPFFSADAGGGTGLGLAIANELANALGGKIQLATEVGRGSTFELVLPAN